MDHWLEIFGALFMHAHSSERRPGRTAKRKRDPPPCLWPRSGRVLTCLAPPQTSKGPKTTGARPTTGPDTPNTAQGSAKWTLGEPLSETPKSPRRPREAVSHTPPFFSTEWACLEVICRIPTGPETPAAWTQTAHETLEPARGSAIDPWASPRVTPNRAQRPKHSRHPFPHACIQRNKGVGGVA